MSRKRQARRQESIEKAKKLRLDSCEKFSGTSYVVTPEQLVRFSKDFYEAKKGSNKGNIPLTNIEIAVGIAEELGFTLFNVAPSGKLAHDH